MRTRLITARAVQMDQCPYHFPYHCTRSFILPCLWLKVNYQMIDSYSPHPSSSLVVGSASASQTEIDIFYGKVLSHFLGASCEDCHIGCCCCNLMCVCASRFFHSLSKLPWLPASIYLYLSIYTHQFDPPRSTLGQRRLQLILSFAALKHPVTWEIKTICQMLLQRGAFGDTINRFDQII